MALALLRAGGWILLALSILLFIAGKAGPQAALEMFLAVIVTQYRGCNRRRDHADRAAYSFQLPAVEIRLPLCYGRDLVRALVSRSCAFLRG